MISLTFAIDNHQTVSAMVRDGPTDLRRIMVVKSDEFVWTDLVRSEGFKLRTSHYEKLEVLLCGLRTLQEIVTVGDVATKRS